MKRRDFLQMCARWAAAAPVASLAMGCGTGTQYGPGRIDGFEVNFDGSVLIIGAGSAGLAAGYALGRHGIEYTVLEASSRFGGRVKRDTTLADFPIDLGAEWIHFHPSVLASLVDDPTVDGTVTTIPFVPHSIAALDDGKPDVNAFGRNYYGDYKFYRTTWYGFLEQYIAPTVAPNIRFDHPVTHIDSTGSRVRVTVQDGSVFEADRVIVTVPIAVLQAGRITITPELDDARWAALDGVWVPHGIKVFSRFSRKFYPDLLLDGGLLNAPTQKLYYNGAFGKDADTHVLSLFWVDDAAAAFTELESDEAIVQAKLAELDGYFGGDASRYHEASVVQNWSTEPWALGAYSNDGWDPLHAAFAEPLHDRIHFAGEAFGPDDNVSTVVGAMTSGYAVVEAILAG